MSKRLDGKTAVITGGSSGIGLATAKRFVQEGAHVYITGRRQSELDLASAEIGSSVRTVQGDVANLADLDRLYELVRKESGKVDIVFANAGIGEFSPLADVTEAHFDKLFDINVKGLLFSVQKALPLLVDGAAIVLNASVVSVKGPASFGVYAATKAAIRSFARTWAMELKDRKIRVNTISPGLAPSPGYRTNLGMNDAQVDQYVQSMVPLIPAGRAGTMDEIASAVLFLASRESSYVNGIELFVDGGWTQV